MTAGGSLRSRHSVLGALVAVAVAALSVLIAAPSARAGIPICDVQASVSNALIGDSVTFTGTGFAANTQIEVFGQLDAGPLTLAATGTTDATGGFVFTTTMPAVGLVTVTFTQTPGCSDSTSVTVTCVGDVTASVSNALVGDPVTFTGSGFAPSTAIAVFGSLDGGPQTPAANGVTGGAGGFVFTATMPIAGVVTITFSQVNGCTDSTSVTVGAAAATPSASGLPDTAMSSPSAPTPVWGLTLAVGLLLVLAVGAIRSRTSRSRR